MNRLPGHSVVPGAADSVLYRQIVDVLTAEYENGPLPNFADGTPPGVIACAWGLYAQVHRHARAAIVLTEAGMDHEAHLHVRVRNWSIEALHWIRDTLRLIHKINFSELIEGMTSGGAGQVTK